MDAVGFGNFIRLAMGGGHMSSTCVAFMMEQTLGNVTHYMNLRREESAAGPAGVVPRWVPIAFSGGRLPWALTGSVLARRALTALPPDVTGLFVHTTTLALLLGNEFKQRAAVLSTDGTPLNKRGMRELYGLKSEGRAGERAKTALYRRVFRRAAGFVAWSSEAKRSLVEDYGCRSEDVEVIPPGIDLAGFAPKAGGDLLPRILFVGGDFSRKGGDLLVDVFRRRLRGRAELILVTKAEVASEPGLEVHTNVGANSPELHRLYAQSDIFALPTRADCYPLAGLEALASGLPMVSTRVGGIPDMIHEGETGHLIAPGDAQGLGDALEALCVDPSRRRAMGEKARRDAEQRFDARRNALRLFAFVRERCA